MAIGKIDTVGSFFVGQGDIIVFDKPADLAAAKLSTLTNPKSLGDIHLDSTDFTGDDPTLNPLKNEQGQIYYSTVEEGTFGFEFFVPSTSEAMLTQFLAAEVITDTFTGANGFSAGSTVVGFMHKPTVSERPIQIINDALNQSLVVPNAKLVAAPSMQDRVSGIKISVIAQKIDTDFLKTVMKTFGAVDYDGV